MPTEEIDTLVIGAGQAGLATSHELTELGVPHVVLDRQDEVGGAWAHRWDSFCLVTPSHSVRLPGGAYAGPEPHGYLSRDAIVTHLRDYAASFDTPVRTGVEVTALRAATPCGLEVRTADGTAIRARAVVVATGAFQRPHRPEWSRRVTGPLVLDSSDYRSPEHLPPGAVLVVGSGQTGCQLAEELALAGRRVILACGRAPWMPRRIDGVDFFDHLVETPFFDLAVADLPSPAARLLAQPQATGAGGGHDLHLRTLAALGVQLAGHVGDAADGELRFADDLPEIVAWGDARHAELGQLIRTSREARGLPAPTLPPPPPLDTSHAPTALPLSEVTAVILTMGYRPDYGSWIGLPDAFDELGFPRQVDGTSSV